ncbi:MAG: hypothetical protein VX938_04805, partial [Myxococcota bacterium]|nr:hypothetical protein [Myxococcota bacterium]
RIEMRPLHQREADIQELLVHFFQQTATEAGLTGCRGLSRQVMADISEAIRDVELASVRMMRDLVRDLVFEVVASGLSPLKITSEHVRPLLATRFGQTEERRIAREKERIESLVEEPVRNALVAHLADLHGVPVEVLEQQMASLEQVIASMDDAPRSYRNIMTRADDILRSGLWLLSGASTQAEFRRFFGEERFMKPTKSVAWAFYNRVFKRDV